MLRHPASFITATLVVAHLAVVAAHSDAASIALTNHSFESPTVSDSFSSFVVNGWATSGGPTAGLSNPTSFTYPEASGDTVPLPGTATGFQYGFVQPANGFLSQFVGALLPNTTYTLTVAFGDVLAGSTQTGRIQLVESESGSVLTQNEGFSGIDGTFVDHFVSYITESAVTGNLMIVLRSPPGIESHYDNVRLDVTAVPEPSAVGSMAGTAGAFVLRRRRRGPTDAPPR